MPLKSLSTPLKDRISKYNAETFLVLSACVGLRQQNIPLGSLERALILLGVGYRKGSWTPQPVVVRVCYPGQRLSSLWVGAWLVHPPLGSTKQAHRGSRMAEVSVRDSCAALSQVSS